MPKPVDPEPRGRFDPSRRLQRKSDFDRVFREGVRARTAHLQCVAAGRVGPSRVGLAIGAGAGGAPARVRLKRLVRAAFRSSVAARPAWREAGIDLVVSIRQPWPEADLRQLGAELELAIDEVTRRAAARRGSRPRSNP